MATSPISGTSRNSVIGFLTVSFEIHIHKKFGVVRPLIEDLEVDRLVSARLRDLNDYLEAKLCPVYGPLPPLLLRASCLRKSHQSDNLRHYERQSPARERRRGPSPVGNIPLVCDDVWRCILLCYSSDHLCVSVHRRDPVQEKGRGSPIKHCFPGLMTRELKHLDVSRYLPSTDLRGEMVKDLCAEIFERGTRVKHDLRRGIWLHLLKVFHPSLTSREEREQYMGKLRMVYDHLKGQRVGQSHLEHQQLVDAVYRDAIRTDSDHPFFAGCRPVDSSYISQHYHQSQHSASSISTGEDNIQKLINIIVIYTLEHGEVAYTQGMTDILSPILYVMKNEADAYIVFAAVINRIKKNFEQWCAGTLLKLQRFRHLCAVLDPELYHSLINNMEEDPFILFFGMVLIECQREFSFEDSFHLLETIWATEACITDSFLSSSDKSLAQWAGYMTLNSPEVLQQVFDGSGGLYSAEPLHQTMSMSYSYSRNPSLLSYSPTQALPFLTRPSEFGPRLGEPSSNPQEQQVVVEVLSSSPPLHSPSINSSLSGSLVESLNARKELEGSGCTSSPLQRKRQQHNMDDDQLTLISQDRLDSRLRSQSDSNLHSISHSMSSQARSPMMRRSMSPQSTPIDNALMNQKLDTSSFSHSESELYDSFSNSRVVVTAQQSSLTKQPVRNRSKKSTEMSDMSSVSSGTASATGLVSSFRSGEDVINGAAFPTNASLTEKTSSSMANGNISTAEKHEETVGNGLPNGDSLRNSIPVFSPDSGVNSETLLSNGLPPSGAGVTGSEVEEGKVLPKKKVSIPSAVGSHNEPHIVSDSISMSRQDVLSHPVNAYYSDHVGPAMDHPRKRSLKQGGRGVGVVEHGGMITAIGHSLKNSLLPNRKSADRNPRPTESLLQPGREVRSRQKTPVDQRKSRMSTSPKRIHGKSTPTDHSINPTPIQYDSDIPSSARVTPVAFFDTMEKLAQSASSSRVSPIRPLVSQRRVQSDDNGRTEVGPSQRANNGLVDQIQDVGAGIEETLEATSIRFDRPSELEASIMSQLVSAEDGAPRITREESLSVPFCECYSLFVCLAILVRKRDEIMQESTDFYRLSEILNSQAGMQDLNKTLGIARKLYKTYRDYQSDTFKWSSNSIDCWLDDTG